MYAESVHLTNARGVRPLGGWAAAAGTALGDAQPETLSRTRGWGAGGTGGQAARAPGSQAGSHPNFSARDKHREPALACRAPRRSIAHRGTAAACLVVSVLHLHLFLFLLFFFCVFSLSAGARVRVPEPSSLLSRGLLVAALLLTSRRLPSVPTPAARRPPRGSA
jgi:hypothetical protein